MNFHGGILYFVLVIVVAVVCLIYPRIWLYTSSATTKVSPASATPTALIEPSIADSASQFVGGMLRMDLLGTWLSDIHHSNYWAYTGTAGNSTMLRSRLLASDLTMHTKKDTMNPITLIKCANQTRCIQPVLQLKKSFNVYYCKHVGHGVRFYFLAKEGLLLHPKINFVATPEEAEIIVYLPVSAPWHKSECAKDEYRSKILVLDEGDGQGLFEPNKGVVMMFKRSYVHRSNGIFGGYMGYSKRIDVLPMTYTIADAYVSSNFVRQSERDLEILCTLRVSKRDPNRARIHQWVSEYSKARGVTKFVDKQVNSASRTVVSKPYFNQMYRSQIIVTTNPSGWEGDFRLMEAMASGALVFVDQMYVPRPYPLFHHKHFVVYDNNNKTDLFEKLDAYRKDKQMARRVALNGYIHSMRYHRAANLIDYVFRTIHVKQMLLAENKFHLLPDAALVGATGTGRRSVANTSFASLMYGYTDTGYHMRQQALSYVKK